MIKKLSRGLSFFLVYNFHFIQQVTGISDLIDNEKDISYIYGNVPANFRVILHVGHDTVPGPVEIQSDQFATGI